MATKMLRYQARPCDHLLAIKTSFEEAVVVTEIGLKPAQLMIWEGMTFMTRTTAWTAGDRARKLTPFLWRKYTATSWFRDRQGSRKRDRSQTVDSRPPQNSLN